MVADNRPAPGVRHYLFTRPEAAAYLGCSPATLADWASRGTQNLPYVKIGRSVKYKKDDLDRFIDERTVTHTGELQ